MAEDKETGRDRAAWVPSATEIEATKSLWPFIANAVRQKWPWAGDDRVIQSAKMTTVEVLVAVSAAMNGSVGALIDLIYFCETVPMPLPAPLSERVAGIVANNFNRSNRWAVDRRLVDCIPRIRFEWIDRIIEFEKEVQRRDFPLPSVVTISTPVPKFAVDAAALKFLGNEEIGIKGEVTLLPMEVRKLIVTRNRHTDISKEYLSIRRKRDGRKHDGMVQLRGWLDNPWISLDGREIWPGRHYLPSDRTLEMLGWGDLVVAVAFATLGRGRDTPSLHQPT